MAEKYYAIDFTAWKKKFLGSFFAPEITLIFKESPIISALKEIPDNQNIVIWANKITPEIMVLSEQKKKYFMADGRWFCSFSWFRR